MLKSFLSGKLSQLLHLYLAWYHKRSGKVARARKRLNRALDCIPETEPFILAFDGVLMIGEDNPQMAKERFAEGLEVAKRGESADDFYVTKFCQFWLAISDENVGFKELKSIAEATNAAWAEASRLEQIYLPRCPLDRLEEICGHRQARAANDWSHTFPSLKRRTSITFEH